jgi:DUF1009 family protein
MERRLPRDGAHRVGGAAGDPGGSVRHGWAEAGLARRAGLPGRRQPRTVGLGRLGSRAPGAIEQAEIVRALGVLEANSPFDVGQAAVVAGDQVIAIEGPEGTDAMLARVAEMRRNGRLRTAAGVLVKAPKAGQDRRVDLPSIGPKTIKGAAEAGLAGIAVLAGSSIVAEPDRFAGDADRAGIFVVGVRPDGSSE